MPNYKINKTEVAHIAGIYFVRSQTFLHFYLSNFLRTQPVCLSLRRSLVNEKEFPFPSTDSYGYPNNIVWSLSYLWKRFSLPGVKFIGLLVQMSHKKQIHWAERILSRRNVQMIHAHFGDIGYQVLPLKKKFNVPLITSFYGYDMVGYPNFEWQNWPQRRQVLFNEADKILVEGPFMRKRLIDLGCPADKVTIQHIAIDVDQLPFRLRKAKTNRKVIVIFAGRFMEKKGIVYALQAVREVRKSGRNIEFRIIGSGELTATILNLIREWEMDKYVKILGFLDYQSYLAEMVEADIFLHPSVTTADGDSEGGAPTVILEAQALGMPVISTYHADIPYITVPEESALLVPERDNGAITDALIYLIDHPESWEKMGRVGRSHVHEFHNIKTEIMRLEDMYLAL